MGIKKYTDNFINKFPSIITNRPKIHTVCVDVNGLLYIACNKSTNKESFKSKLYKCFNTIIKKNKPEFFALFTDGQAVLAKAKLQIKRRNKFLYTDNTKNISTLNLTPGTPFMDFVDKIIKEYLDNLDIPSYYSPSIENNEGELKIFEWLKNNRIDENICIIGDDADIIVLSLLNTPLLNVYIYNHYKYISLFKLIHNLAPIDSNRFNYKIHPIRKDIALLSILQGNDYNKKLSNFNDLFSAYEKFKPNNGYLINKNNSINLNNFKIFLKNVYNNDTKKYPKANAKKYIDSLLWNLDLYTGKIISNFLPLEYNINIQTLLKYMPYKINKVTAVDNWIHPDIYLLLLMPSVGKELLPDNLKHFMDKDSPIIDLFPDPCPECIFYKEKISELIPPDNNCSDEIKEEYKSLSREINSCYNLHIEQEHNNDLLPIQRIQDALL